MDISPIVVERFDQAMRQMLTTGEAPLRKAYLGAIVDRVEVDYRQIRIVGRKDVLEQAVLTTRPCARGSQFCSQMALPTGVEPVFSD